MEARVRRNTPNSGGLSGAQLQQQDDYATRAILAVAENMVQQIDGRTISSPGSTNNVINYSQVIRLVGLLKRFYIEVIGTFTPDGSVDCVATAFNAANMLSNITLTDLSNNTRINTTGWHLHFVSSAKRGRPYDGAYTTDSPIVATTAWPAIVCPALNHGGGNQTVRMIYEVPVTYSDADLRGMIWLGVTSATMNLQLTINPAPIVNSSSVDPTNAVYSRAGSPGTAALSSVTINLYQNYLDQLPTARQKDGSMAVVLPFNSMSTVYMLQNTTPPLGILNNVDNPTPYSNFRDFLSTFAVFDNGGTLNNGSDVNYWAIQAANFVNSIKIDPTISALWSRNTINIDWPDGVYYFSHRHKPISTQQFGNTQLIVNPSTVNSNAKLLIAYEMFALVNLVAQAGALTVA